MKKARAVGDRSRQQMLTFYHSRHILTSGLNKSLTHQRPAWLSCLQPVNEPSIHCGSKWTAIFSDLVVGQMRDLKPRRTPNEFTKEPQWLTKLQYISAGALDITHTAGWSALGISPAVLISRAERCRGNQINQHKVCKPFMGSLRI